MRRITDEELKSLVLEIMSTNVITAFIQCPSNETDSLAIKLPYFIMILKNLKKYFSFEIQILGKTCNLVLGKMCSKIIEILFR